MKSLWLPGGKLELPFQICNSRTSEEIRPCAHDSLPSWLPKSTCCVRSENGVKGDTQELVPDDQGAPWLVRDHDSICDPDGERVITSVTYAYDSTSFAGCGRFPDVRFCRKQDPLVNFNSPGGGATQSSACNTLLHHAHPAPQDNGVAKVFVPPVMPRVPSTPAGHLGMEKPREATLRRKPKASQKDEKLHTPEPPPPAKVDEVEPTVIPTSTEDEFEALQEQAVDPFLLDDLPEEQVAPDKGDAGDIEFGWDGYSKEIPQETRATPSAKRLARPAHAEEASKCDEGLPDPPERTGGDVTPAGSAVVADEESAPVAVRIDQSPAGDEAVSAAPSVTAHGSGAVRVLIVVSAESASADKLEEWCCLCGIEYLMVVKAEAAAGIVTWRKQVCKAFTDLCEQSWPGDVCVLLLAGLQATEDEDESEPETTPQSAVDDIPEGSQPSLLGALPMYSTLLCISDSRQSTRLFGLDEVSCVAAEGQDPHVVVMLMCFDAFLALGMRRRADFFTQVLVHLGKALSLADGPCSLPCKAVFEEMTDQAVDLSARRGIPAPRMVLYAHPSVEVANNLQWPIAKDPCNIMSLGEDKANRQLAEKSAAAGQKANNLRPDLNTCVHGTPRGRKSKKRRQKSADATPQNVPGNINELAFLLSGGMQKQRAPRARSQSVKASAWE